MLPAQHFFATATHRCALPVSAETIQCGSQYTTGTYPNTHARARAHAVTKHALIRPPRFDEMQSDKSSGVNRQG